MIEPGSLYIERPDCGDCCNCVRGCVVKAIDMPSRGAVIDAARCVECGACLRMCDRRSVKLRDDVYMARQFVAGHAVKVASVSPEWIFEFPGVSAGRFAGALRMLGFTHVSESALGAQASLAEEARLLAGQGGIGISTRCPAIVSYIHKYRPRMKPMLLDAASPVTAHARMVRQWWGDGAHTVHISSCAAAKNEAARSRGLVDLALTYRELRQWMREEGINPADLPGPDAGFEPFTANSATGYTLTGRGAQHECREQFERQGIVTVTCSGLGAVDAVLREVPSPQREAVYLDLTACPGGCMGSAAVGVCTSSIDLRVMFDQRAAQRRKRGVPYELPQVDLSGAVEGFAAVGRFVAEGDVLRALASLGMAGEKERINCNGCGYGSCRAFAMALARGEVNRGMCTAYVRSELRARFNTLLSKMASGVAVVNSAGRIVEMNRMLATMMGPQAEMLYDASPGLAGMRADELMPFAGLMEPVFDGAQESVVRDVQVKERILTVSVHAIARHDVALVICRNLMFAQVRNEQIVERTQRVIRENLDTVQKIAYLLGENASRTEAMLNSILETHGSDEGRQ